MSRRERRVMIDAWAGVSVIRATLPCVRPAEDLMMRSYVRQIEVTLPIRLPAELISTCKCVKKKRQYTQICKTSEPAHCQQPV